MRCLKLIILMSITLHVNAQRQKEITDFIEKWNLDVIDMKLIEINGLPGTLKITGSKDSMLDIKVTGDDVYLLNGGITGLGFILSKDRFGAYRIQGIGNSSETLDVTYEIKLPAHVHLKIHQSGSQYQDSSSWKINNMIGTIELKKIKGDIRIAGAVGPLSLLSFEGDLDIGYADLYQKKPHSFATSGKITLKMQEETAATIQAHLYKNITINTEASIYDDDKLSQGANLLKKGNYNFKLHGGGILIDIHAYDKSINLKFYD